MHQKILRHFHRCPQKIATTLRFTKNKENLYKIDRSSCNVLMCAQWCLISNVDAKLCANVFYKPRSISSTMNLNYIKQSKNCQRKNKISISNAHTHIASQPRRYQNANEIIFLHHLTVCRCLYVHFSHVLRLFFHMSNAHTAHYTKQRCAVIIANPLRATNYQQPQHSHW